MSVLPIAMFTLSPSLIMYFYFRTEHLDHITVLYFLIQGLQLFIIMVFRNCMYFIGTLYVCLFLWICL